MAKMTSGIATRNFIAEYDPPFLSRSPHARLWEAVIYRAVWDYKHFWESGASSLSKLTEARRAQIWVFQSYDSAEDTGSFLWCCNECFPEFADTAVNKIRKELLPPLPSAEDLRRKLFRTA